jgi:hypothetical protein
MIAFAWSRTMPRYIRGRHRPVGRMAYLPSIHNRGADSLKRRISFDELGAVHCPICHGPLVARMSCRGPYWYCRCRERRRAA